MKQFPLDRTFIVSFWLEALVYGAYLPLFFASIWVSVSLRRFQDRHSKIMFAISIVMFAIATMHLAMQCFRMIRGFIDHADRPGGAVAYLANLAPWDHIFKDTLYATQEIFGDGVAIYRCWVIWHHNWGIVFLPILIFLLSCVSGYMVCGLYTSVDPTDTVFDPRLTQWIKIFYSSAVVQSTITTALMAYRIWKADKKATSYRAGGSNLLPVLRIMVESAALQLFMEALLLGLYAAHYNAQYIILEVVTPVIGITFAAMNIRISLRMSGGFSGKAKSSPAASGRRQWMQNRQPTIGQDITINISTDIEDHRDGASDKLKYKTDA